MVIIYLINLKKQDIQLGQQLLSKDALYAPK